MSILKSGKRQQKHEEDGMEAWRQQQPGESRKECLLFHHRDRSQKEFTIGNIIRNGVSLETLQREIAKCDVLCANCHSVIEQQKRNRNKRREIVIL